MAITKWSILELRKKPRIQFRGLITKPSPRPVSGRGLAEPHGVADVLSQEAVGSIRDFRTAKIALAKRKPRPNRRRAGFSGAIGYGGLRKGSA